MLKDSRETYNTYGNADLSAGANHSANILLNFIDTTIPGFPKYYYSAKISDGENAISNCLVNYFNAWLLEEQDGFAPYNFGKNPPQKDSNKETDIGVAILNKESPPLTILEFEAKRLSDSANNKEYVCGTKGGIERFKRSHHAEHLDTCGMFGYVQSKSPGQWIEKINNWISDLAENNIDESIDWKTVDEKLYLKTESTNATKYVSTNSRKAKKSITLNHYFINLIPKN